MRTLVLPREGRRRLRPVDAAGAHVTGGFWAERLATNRERPARPASRTPWSGRSTTPCCRASVSMARASITRTRCTCASGRSSPVSRPATAGPGTRAPAARRTSCARCRRSSICCSRPTPTVAGSGWRSTRPRRSRRRRAATSSSSASRPATRPTGGPYFGCITGRYANRIARGTFRIDGAAYPLANNDGPHALHGGLKGCDKVVRAAEAVESGRALEVWTEQPGIQSYSGDLLDATIE